MNPFISIWREPKKTIQYMIDHKTLWYGLLIILLGALSSSIMAFADTGFLEGFSLPVILTIAIVSSLVISIPAWFINAALFTWIGKLLGGTGNIRTMCLVVTAGAIPMIWLMPIGIIAVMIYGETLFATPPGEFGITNMSIGFYLFYNFLLFAVGIFGLVIASKGVGLAHNFSAWRGFGTIMIITGIFFLISIIVIIFFIIIFAGFVWAVF